MEEGKALAAGCWFPPKENMPVGGAAAAAGGCDPPKLNPKLPFDAPLAALLEDMLENGLFTGVDEEKPKPGSPPPPPNPPNDTFGDPFPIGGVLFVGGKLWAPLVKRPGC